MRVMKPLLTGMVLAIAGIITFSMSDTALAAKAKSSQAQTEPSQAQPQRSDRQLEGRFYKRHHKKTTTQAK